MLAVKVDYSTGEAVVGTAIGAEVPREEILAALKSINYGGEFLERPAEALPPAQP